MFEVLIAKRASASDIEDDDFQKAVKVYFNPYYYILNIGESLLYQEISPGKNGSFDGKFGREFRTFCYRRIGRENYFECCCTSSLRELGEKCNGGSEGRNFRAGKESTFVARTQVKAHSPHICNARLLIGEPGIVRTLIRSTKCSKLLPWLCATEKRVRSVYSKIF